MPVTISALTWNSGSPPSIPSPAASPLHTAIPRPQASWLAWVCAATFGAPVVPPVCTNAARSSAAGRSAPARWLSGCPAITSSR